MLERRNKRESVDELAFECQFVDSFRKCGISTIYVDGSQTRPFCYIDDMIEGFKRLMATDEAFTGPHLTVAAKLSNDWGPSLHQACR